MAADWIKMRVELQTHPKVVRILSATRSDKFRVIGGLHAVWSVFDAHSEDGFLHGYTPETLDHIIGWEGFSSAMVLVGWLNFDGKETLCCPDFIEHNGSSAKRRAEDSKRKRGQRSSDKYVQEMSAEIADKLRTNCGVEKRKRKNISISSLRSDIDCDSQSGEAQKVAQRKTSGTPKRATALPDDYTPNQAATELAKELGVDLQAEFARFTDYYRAKGGAMKDWDAALRNWIRKAKEYANNAVKPFNYQSRESLRAIAAKSRLSDFLNDDGTMKSSGASDASDTHILGR